MFNYGSKDMNMVGGHTPQTAAHTDGHRQPAAGHMAMSGHGGHKESLAMEHAGHAPAAAADPGGHGDHSGGRHHHATEGLGDTSITALYKFWSRDNLSAHAGLGVGLPTADVEERMGGAFQPYGMQLGNGVWDLRPSLTYLGRTDRWSWGTQASARINLEDENDAGFAYGDEYGATVWGARKVAEAVSLSGRLRYAHQDSIGGRYSGDQAHNAPPFGEGNYGGDVVEAGIGANFVGTSGFIRGHRLAVEVLAPVYEDLNGVQLQREYSVIVGWQKGF